MFCLRSAATAATVTAQPLAHCLIEGPLRPLVRCLFEETWFAVCLRDPKDPKQSLGLWLGGPDLLSFELISLIL